eukprot:1941845-Amphidinium_carterae.1
MIARASAGPWSVAGPDRAAAAGARLAWREGGYKVCVSEAMNLRSQFCHARRPAWLLTECSLSLIHISEPTRPRLI